MSCQRICRVRTNSLQRPSGCLILLVSWRWVKVSACSGLRYAWNLLDLFKVEFIWIGLVCFQRLLLNSDAIVQALRIEKTNSSQALINTMSLEIITYNFSISRFSKGHCNVNLELNAY